MNVIVMRKKHLVNTDPQRRCYNGAHYNSETVWGEWKTIDWDIKDVVKRLKFWRELTDYAISERGESARSEFKHEIR